MVWLGGYLILIALSGWNVIVYSDIPAMLFVISILRLYQLLGNNQKFYAKWVAIIALSYWGMKIKPTVIIVTIAIIVIEGLSLIKTHRSDVLKKMGVVLLMTILSVSSYSVIYDKLVDSTGLVIDKNECGGAMHYLMMGLNPTRDGVWAEEDVLYTMSFHDNQQRREAQIEVIKERISTYGFWGMLNHLAKKTMVNYNDGTFAWGQEGGFFSTEFDNKNSLAAPILKNCYYPDRRLYPFVAVIQQMFWIVTIFLSMGMVLLRRDHISLVIMLSVVGITLFTLLFEARARYLIPYVPFFIMLAVFSYKEVCLMFKRRFLRV